MDDTRPQPSPTSTEAASTTPPVQTLPPDNANNTTAERPIVVVRLDDCKGIQGTGEMSLATAERLVPDSFSPEGLTMETASLDMAVMACDKATTEAAVYRRVSFVQVRILANPVNKSWDKTGLDFFVIDQLVQGFPMLRAWNATITFANLSTAAGTAHRWSVRNGSSSYELEAPSTGAPMGSGQASMNYWFGSGPFTRVSSVQSYEYDSAYNWPVTVRSSGSGPAQAAFQESPVLPLAGSLNQRQLSFSFDPKETYREE